MPEDLQTQFSRDAALLPHMLDVLSDQVLLSRLSEADYRKASFLDQRIITPELARETVPWKNLSTVPLQGQPTPFYIFHIGHVGSTLISRLIGEHKDVLALREPHILRSFADISQIKNQPHSPWAPDMYSARLAQTQRWLARTFRPSQRTIIKASSFVSEIARDLITPDTKALFLYVSFPRYLETILAGEGSRQEAMQMAGARLTRIHQSLGHPIANLWALSHGQKIALGWICEMITLIQAYERSEKAHIKWLNFDDFLSAPAKELTACLEHFELGADPGFIDAQISGPIMRSYSKAPEHNYSADLRQDLLRQARQNFAPEITNTTQWIQALAEKTPSIKTALTFKGIG
ncbi:MAG: hypothetical protein ACSHXY_03995 [Alphaproteobacteria bacterium]